MHDRPYLPCGNFPCLALAVWAHASASVSVRDYNIYLRGELDDGPVICLDAKKRGGRVLEGEEMAKPIPIQSNPSQANKRFIETMSCLSCSVLSCVPSDLLTQSTPYQISGLLYSNNPNLNKLRIILLIAYSLRNKELRGPRPRPKTPRLCHC